MLSLKVFSYGKFKLFDEYFLESIKVVLFVKDEHSLLVINRINRTKTKWTIAISYQKCSIFEPIVIYAYI